jgi:MerR family mercuric resistance operon transcriptional regulator
MLRFIRRAQGYGMSLEEVKQVLTLVANGRRPCGRVREIAREHLVEISSRIKDLELFARSDPA